MNDINMLERHRDMLAFQARKRYCSRLENLHFQEQFPLSHNKQPLSRSSITTTPAVVVPSRQFSTSGATRILTCSSTTTTATTMQDQAVASSIWGRRFASSSSFSPQSFPSPILEHSQHTPSSSSSSSIHNTSTTSQSIPVLHQEARRSSKPPTLIQDCLWDTSCPMNK